jgi:hypothetical protein
MAGAFAQDSLADVENECTELVDFLSESRADRAVDAIRERFGGQAVDYGAASQVALRP